MSAKLGCIILAAGKGTRMNSALPKPLHKIAGRSMIGHIIAEAEKLSPEKIVVVIGPGMEEHMAPAVAPHATALQTVANGTGGAALAAAEYFKGFDGDILIIFGDHPLLTAQSMRATLDKRQTPGAGLVFSGMRPADAGRYGRMVVDENGVLEKIVEFKDATDPEKAITLCNGGLVCAEGGKLFQWLSQIGNNNAQNEYYLTELPTIARRDNRITYAIEIPVDEMEAANSREELATLELLLQTKMRKTHMANGATLTDPSTVFFCHDTKIGRDVTIGPNVVFGPGVTVADGVEILPFSHIEGAAIATGAAIGPFARIRPGSVIGEKAKIGNFVETKNATIGTGAKVNHLSYVGDATVGDKSNIGAGTITCNYDGVMKYKTTIGRDVMIGSNSALVAPVTIGDGAFVAAGSVVTKDVAPDALGITRALQKNIAGWAQSFRAKKTTEKSKKD